MKAFAMICLSLFFTGAYSQEVTSEVNTPYHLPAPQGWGTERFPVPISFAPQIPYKGVEDIRFAPGWAKAASDEYWSYAFLWCLDGKVETDAKIIESNMSSYYSGLIAANGPAIPEEKLIPVAASFKEVAKDTNDQKTFTGTIRLLDYMQQQPIVLNCKVHVRSCAGQTNTFLFYELSPKPLSHPVWLSLDKLWDDFECKSK